ncbi:MAG: hypothetical protein IPM79_32500 [Polyangiaceae bacterium]|nr:hypothetical protein [Polyangiaceae bacterium]MBK8942202.1 hypothetical protein [Polyangiaceae bacterium]
MLQATPKQDERLAQAMLLAPVFASVLIYFWIGSMNLLQGPSSSLAVVGIGTIVITSALAAADANRLGIGAPGDPHKGTSPVGWAAFILLFWIVGYPAYLYRRKTYGAQSYLFVGILVGLLFIVSWFVMGSAIEVRQSEIRGIPGR